jgi:serine/threonine protein phosphatase PrpC
MASLRVTVGTVTDRGLNPRRAANEDRFLALPEAGIFLVADGVGGRRAGQVASQTVVDTFAEAFSARAARGRRAGLEEAVGEAIARANESIRAQARELAELEGMATTLALVALENQRAVIAHVGDSRVYRFDGERLHLETADHSDLGDAVRAGEMTYAEAARAEQQSVINRALGVEAEAEADFKTVAVGDGTRFLICSDGVTRHISDTELESLLGGDAHPERVCARLKELCFARGAEDNLTAVIVDLGARRYADGPAVGVRDGFNGGPAR